MAQWCAKEALPTAEHVRVFPASLIKQFHLHSSVCDTDCSGHMRGFYNQRQTDLFKVVLS